MIEASASLDVLGMSLGLYSWGPLGWTGVTVSQLQGFAAVVCIKSQGLWSICGSFNCPSVRSWRGCECVQGVETMPLPMSQEFKYTTLCIPIHSAFKRIKSYPSVLHHSLL